MEIAGQFFTDTQIKTFLITTLSIAIFVFFVLNSLFPGDWENSLRKSLFNITSIISGTGYSSDNYMKWGGMLVSIIFFIGLIGGCAGSTTCSVKVFRYQLVASAILLQLRKIRYPHRVVVLKYDGRPVAEDVLHSVMTFFVVVFFESWSACNIAVINRIRSSHVGFGGGGSLRQYWSWLGGPNWAVFKFYGVK